MSVGGFRASLLDHAEQKSPTVYSLNIRNQLVSGFGRIPAPHNIGLNP